MKKIKPRVLNNRRIVGLLLLGLTIGTSSCGMFNKNLAKRYSNNSRMMFANAREPQKLVQAELNSSLINGQTTTPAVIYNILSLSPEGQAQFIKSFDSKTANRQELVDQLNKNFAFSKKTTNNVKIISKTVKKSLVFTIDRLQYQHSGPGGNVVFNYPGDRIAYLQLDVQLSAGSKATFNSWDKYLTDHMNLNLGKVSSAQQWNASANLSAKAGSEVSLSGNNSSEDFDSSKQGTVAVLNGLLDNGTSSNTGSAEQLNTYKDAKTSSNGLKTTGELGGSASIGYSDKYETALDITSRILKLSGTLRENKIILRQEGGQGIDLSGNIVASVDYQLTDDWATPVNFIKYEDLYINDTPVAVSALKSHQLTVIFPDIQNDITGTMDYSFLFRQIRKGSKHLPEARHKVKFWFGMVPNAQNILHPGLVTLIKTTDVRPKSYTIESGGALAIGNAALVFETTVEAANFLNYVGSLLKTGGNVANLKFAGAPLNQALYNAAKIKTNNL